ncbi:hypothetical protein [Candidatus Marimicrobium litorale]|uniref:Integral membrane protein n=1 Tax=Candidatus Marimicrobium litorale TaxID=2518991 RepID=A0ABT3T5W4_9GAMM|nr:hypothetical protein [Candidatus Marimicrobium litorale]MCX2977668.1 hypothetical protein [Candidatus Marimicrobium litorale]
METAEKLAIVSAGVFFLTALLTGIWKYRQIMAAANGEAHPYVDICHRASLLYAFAAMLLAKFVEISQLPAVWEILATAAVVFYFAVAILSYMVHGLLQDTENQLKAPFRLGQTNLSAHHVSVHMWMLIAAEVGGFLILFYGVLAALF